MPSDLPPLKTDPKYGYFPWWPEDGNDWVHPEDVELARSMIPSPRIWRRDGTVSNASGDDFVIMHYGDVQLRVRRVLWRTVTPDEYDLGDMVEVSSHGFENEPLTGRIREMRWDDHTGAIHYWLTLPDGSHHERSYPAEDLKHAEKPIFEPEIRREPTDETGDDLEIMEP